MKRILTYFTIMVMIVSCDLYGGPEASLPADVPAGIEISFSEIKDDSFTVTITPSGESSYYSYLVDDAEQAEVLNADNLYQVKYKSVAQGTAKWSSETRGTTITVNNLSPNTTYQVYAVAGSPMGFPGEVEVKSVKTTDRVNPELVDYSPSASASICTLEFSEDVVIGTGNVTARYFGINTKSIGQDVEIGTVTADPAKISCTGNTVEITFTGIPNGAYYAVEYPEGTFKDSAGNPVEALVSGFSTTSNGLAPYGVYGRAPKVPFKLAEQDVESFSDPETTFTTSSDSDIYALAALGKGTVQAIYSTDGKTITFDLAYGSGYTLTIVEGIASAVFALPETPEYGANVEIIVAEDSFQDAYGNSNEAWTLKTLFAYTYTINDVIGSYAVDYESYFKGSGNSTFTIEESDDGEKGNVMFIEFMGFASNGENNIYATFNPKAGTLTIPDWQPLFDLPAYFAVNTDNGEPTVLKMPQTGTLVSPSLWFGIHTGERWYDVYTDVTAMKQESTSAGTASVNFNLAARSSQRVIKY